MNEKNSSSVNTGGGAYVGGKVNTGGGDFVGRDKNVTAGEQGVAIGGNGIPPYSRLPPFSPFKMGGLRGWQFQRRYK